ncbi:hypothetical protein [Donghicola sp. XS_ASV15]|uniref:hypothetical protein n=1 Tax=Donghicola sp. XS_ASV15 TaxID=3241295 RepID=UPI0035177DDD
MAVRTDLSPKTALTAFDGMDLSQSGRAVRASTGGGIKSKRAGWQRAVIKT